MGQIFVEIRQLPGRYKFIMTAATHDRVQAGSRPARDRRKTKLAVDIPCIVKDVNRGSDYKPRLITNLVLVEQSRIPQQG